MVEGESAELGSREPDHHFVSLARTAVALHQYDLAYRANEMAAIRARSSTELIRALSQAHALAVKVGEAFALDTRGVVPPCKASQVRPGPWLRETVGRWQRGRVLTGQYLETCR